MSVVRPHINIRESAEVLLAVIMKLAVALSLFSVSSAAVLEARGDCHGNNCNRAVTGTREGLLPFASRSADCSSFMLATVTPAPA